MSHTYSYVHYAEEYRLKLVEDYPRVAHKRGRRPRFATNKLTRRYPSGRSRAELLAREINPFVDLKKV